MHIQKRPREGAFFVKEVRGLFAVDDGNERAANLGASELLDLLGRKLHQPVTERKQGVVDANANAGAGFHPSAALTNEYAAGPDKLATKELNAQSLGS
jgi:hypothetical protein